MTLVFVIAPDPTLTHQIRQVMRRGDIDARLVNINVDNSPDEAAKELTVLNPDMILIGPGLPTSFALEMAAAVERERPEIPVLLVAPREPEVLSRALHAGVRDVLSPDATTTAIAESIEHAIETIGRLRANLRAEPAGASRSGRVIVVLSPKGGAGKTAIATNLAVGLAKAAPRQVVLVDGDIQFGDVGNALRIVPDRTLVDVARSANLDATALKVFLIPHPSGLYALCAPEAPGEADEVSPELVANAVRLLADEFPYVVVDTDAGLGEHTLAVAELATDLVLVCATDVPSVRGVRKEIEALGLIGLTAAERHLVLNRADARVGLSIEDIEATLERSIDIAVPSTRTIPISLNQGSPVLESGTDSPAAGPLLALVDRFLGAAAVGRERPIRRRRWRMDR